MLGTHSHARTTRNPDVPLASVFCTITVYNENSSFHWLQFVAIENGKYHENQWKYCEPTEDTAT